MYSKNHLSKKCLFFPEGLFQVRNEMGWESLDATEDASFACWTLKQIGWLVQFTLGLSVGVNPDRISLVMNCPTVDFNLYSNSVLPAIWSLLSNSYSLTFLPWSSISNFAAPSDEENWEPCIRMHKFSCGFTAGPLPSTQSKRVVKSFLHYLLDGE